MRKISLIKISLCTSLLVLVLNTAQAKEPHTQRHYLATKNYYAQLIAGYAPHYAPRLAELQLMMNMMPKGGDLHHHYSGSIYAETYLDWVGKQGYCIYRHNDPAKNQEKYRIETGKPSNEEADKNCLTADAVRKDNTFYREILMRWSDKDFSNHSHNQSPPDQHFFDTFGYFGAVSGYSTNEGLKMLKARAKAENLQYLETMLKSAPSIDNPELAAKIDNLPVDVNNAANQDALHAALSAYADFIANDAAAQKKIADYAQGIANDAANLDDADFTLRIQTYVSRNSAPSKVFSGLYSAFAATQANPLIVAVNIVGPENGYIALRDYKLHMRMFHFLKQRFPSVRLALHAGELTLGMVPPEELRSHIRDAIDIAGAQRIGHGIDVTHEDRPDQLLNAIKSKNVTIEINLTSNEFILGVQQQAHPVTVYLRHRIPIVLSTDDSGVSRNNLTGEYVLFASRYQPSYDLMKHTVYNSIRYAFLDDKEKQVQLRKLDERFARFEAAIAKLAKLSN